MRAGGFIACYLIVISILGFLAMGMDKSRARRHAYRIPEAVLFNLAVLGACPGLILGMYVFRHKTKKPRFYLGLPVILFIQIIAAVLVIRSGILIQLL